MKKFLLILCAALVYIACESPLSPPQGKGSFILSIAGEPARTILPDTGNAANALKSYKLTFKLGGTGSGIVHDRTPATLSNPIYLEAGTYSLDVIGYADTAGEAPLAHGSLNDIVIAQGEATSRAVSLTAYGVVAAQNGTFSWNITIPSGASATMKITPLSGGSAEETVTLTGGAASRSLVSGYYQITIELAKANNQNIIWYETLHVYQNMTSPFEHGFTDADFTVNKYTVTFILNDGSANGKQTRAHGGSADTFAPTRSGYVFDGWYTDNTTFANAYNFTTVVTGDLSLYAKWLKIIDIAAIPLTPPATDEDPQTAIETAQYTGTVTWNPDDSPFEFEVVYTAAITLTAKPGCTLHGVAANFFTVAGADEVVSNAANSGVITAVFPETVGSVYVITGSGTEFTAKFRGATVGTANQSIDNILTAIRSHANSEDVAIQFGNRVDVLDIGTASASFTTANPAWGAITLRGKITSANTTATQGTVMTGGAVSITSMADIANSGNGGRAVYHNSTGTVTVSGGEISATDGSGVAIYNATTGKITVSGTALVTGVNTTATSGTIVIADNGNATAERLAIIGGTVCNTVDSANARAVYNASTGAVNISGGEVSATNNGRAVHNNSTGAINISGGTVSATTGQTVYNDSTGTVNISGGEVSATNGRAVHNNSTGAVNISGGTVSATNGRAVHNNSTGAVNISGGTVSATGQAVYNDSTGKITVSGTALVTGANTSTTSGTIYLAGTTSGTEERLAITGGTVTTTVTANSGNGGRAVYNASTGAVNISGGTVSASSGSAVYNVSTGKITVSGTAIVTNYSSSNATIHIGNSGTDTAERLAITGGTVSSTSNNANARTVNNQSTGAVNITGGEVSGASGRVVNNNSTGAVNISGGTVSATGASASAVYNVSTGKITVSGTPSITSANTSTSSGTVHLNNVSGTSPVLSLPGNWAELIKNTLVGRNPIYPTTAVSDPSIVEIRE